MPSGKPGHGSKRPTDAQPQNEILRSWGLGGNPNKQRRKPNGYPGALLAAFFAEMKRAREETVKFHSLAQFASIFLDSSVNSCMVSCVWCSRVSRISDGQLE